MVVTLSMVFPLTATTVAPAIASASVSVTVPAMIPPAPSATVRPWPDEPTITVWDEGASVPSATLSTYVPGVRLSRVVTPDASVVALNDPSPATLALRLTPASSTGPDPLLTVTCTEPVPAVRVGTVVGDPIVAETAAVMMPTAGDAATTSIGPLWVTLNW